MPFSKDPSNISPTEFEVEVLNHFRSNPYNFKLLEIIHDKSINTSNQNYQIDIYFEFEYQGFLYKTLVECKRHNSRIKRDAVQLLSAKLQETGCQKGILVSASDFQKGAIELAKQKGISLVRILNGEQTIELMGQSYSQVDLIDYRKNINVPDFSFQEWILKSNGHIGFTSIDGEYKGDHYKNLIEDY